MLTRTRIRIASVVAVVAALGVAGTLSVKGQGRSMTVDTNPRTLISSHDLEAAARTRVFFGHQSVGMNVIEGVGALYAARGAAAPPVAELGADTNIAVPSTGGGFLDHAYLGRNGDPLGKIRDFDTRMRSGLAQRVDVALFKFCYVDVTSDTDVDALFQVYRSTMAALERDYPHVTFLHVTTPLTTESGLKGKLKKLLGGGDQSAADNVARQHLNSLMRREYGGSGLFDLAAIESTAPDGSRVTGSYEGQRYFALYGGYASDNGHLTTAGSEIAAARLLELVARAHEGQQS